MRGRAEGGRGRVPKTAAVAVLFCALTGCHHKKVQPLILPTQQAPVALDTPPTELDGTVLEPPKAKLPEVPLAEAAAKPKRVRKKPVKASAPPPSANPDTSTQVAKLDSASETSVIGALTPGGEQNPKTEQEAAELIASTDRRLNALPEQTVKAQGPQISKIRNFWSQAQKALKSGDAEGAKTLATKAKLLLDDLDKAEL